MIKNSLHSVKKPVPGVSKLAIGLSPSGQLYLYEDLENQETLCPEMADKIQSFFSDDPQFGLLHLGLTDFSQDLPITFAFWQQFSKLFITEICKHVETAEELNPYPQEEIDILLSQAPFMRGIEYLTQEIVPLLWQGLRTALTSELKMFNGNLSAYLSKFHSAWHTVGRVYFHLADNKNNTNFPFAFLATYTTGLSKTANVQHLPLGKALEEQASKNKKSSLISLLLPVHRASEKSPFLKNLVDSGSVFKPQAWRAQEAFQFLKEVPEFEAAGIIVRVPNWWNVKKPPRPQITIKIGDKATSELGLNAMLDFDMELSLPSGEVLTASELNNLLKCTEQMVQIKGQWVHIDHEKINQVLAHWKRIQQQVKKEGLSFAQGLRLLAGIGQDNKADNFVEEISTWSTIIEGDWLRSTLTHLRNKDQDQENGIQKILKKSLMASLRPYQEQGVQWLWWLYNLRLGGCLADDMGLGKTIQVISLFLLIQQKCKENSKHLLVLPASLLGNWQMEMLRFAPSLSFWVAHSSMNKEDKKPDLSSINIVITTYGTLSRLSWLSEMSWDLVVLDEAQAIKNPTAKQTRAIKLLNSKVRLALTGTPIENRLLDLWSLFDFIAPGLLGSSNTFANYGKSIAKNENNKNQGGKFHAAIRQLVRPYILRRLKSDKRIISDLPDKTEMQTYCTLTKHQASLYQQAVNELNDQLAKNIAGINRRGLVLSFLLRFKQICNHPNQWLGHGHYDHAQSGKFFRLQELCEVIAEKQDKVLVFTQFREIMPALNEFLSQIFKRQGLCLDGSTPIKERAKRVEQFQQDQGPPFFILSLKAGGTGLNLTAASHVIHFDRWWNPAVENQATDRAYRIGQKKNVLVHKFICQGTIEEKIDKLLNSKKSLSYELVEQEGEIALTEFSDAELMNIITLDIHRALGEN